MTAKAMNLFEAYAKSALPDTGGYIVSTFFDPTSPYARYEVVAYGVLKNLTLDTDGLVFQADGNKVFVLCEPPAYVEKQVEPYARDARHAVPHRYSELETFTAKNQTKVMVSKQPVLIYSSFTILRPTGNDLAVLFYKQPDVMETLEHFLQETLNKEANIHSQDAKKAAGLVLDVVKRFTIFR